LRRIASRYLADSMSPAAVRAVLGTERHTVKRGEVNEAAWMGVRARAGVSRRKRGRSLLRVTIFAGGLDSLVGFAAWVIRSSTEVTTGAGRAGALGAMALAGWRLGRASNSSCGSGSRCSRSASGWRWARW
jgi:hypothetical protein